MDESISGQLSALRKIYIKVKNNLIQILNTQPMFYVVSRFDSKILKDDEDQHLNYWWPKIEQQIFHNTIMAGLQTGIDINDRHSLRSLLQNYLGMTKSNFKYWSSKIWKEHRSLFQLTWEPNFNDFQAPNHCHKSAKLDLQETLVTFEIALSQNYANFNYQQVTDGNKTTPQFLFSFHKLRLSKY